MQNVLGYGQAYKVQAGVWQESGVSWFQSHTVMRSLCKVKKRDIKVTPESEQVIHDSCCADPARRIRTTMP